MAFKINIPQEVYDKIMHWVNKSSNEVGGLGKCVYNAETQTFDIIDAWLLEQEVGGAHTDLAAESVNKLMYDSRDVEGTLNWWWHSHVKMNVFFSGTDKATIEEFGKHGYLLATVFNQKNEIHSGLGYTYESKSELGSTRRYELVEKIETEVLRYLDADMVAQWDAEFTANVKPRQYAYVSPNVSLYNQYQDTVAKVNAADGNKADTSEASGYSHKTYEDDWGLLGFGLQAEAEVLGLTARAYAAILRENNNWDLARLECELEKAVDAGKLYYLRGM